MEQQNQKRVNSGYLFPNKEKRTDKQPDYRGKYTDEKGKEWLVSGWKRNKDGEEMISLSLTDPASLPQRPQGAGQGGGAPSGTARGPMARPAAPAPAPAAGGFKPSGGASAGGASYDDLDDLDSLFQGVDDKN